MRQGILFFFSSRCLEFLQAISIQCHHKALTNPASTEGLFVTHPQSQPQRRSRPLKIHAKGKAILICNILRYSLYCIICIIHAGMLNLHGTFIRVLLAVRLPRVPENISLTCGVEGHSLPILFPALRKLSCLSIQAIFGIQLPP